MLVLVEIPDGKLNSPIRMTTGSISNEIKLLIDGNENIDSFDFISFDSCLMGGVEILSDFAGLCDVLFANAELFERVGTMKTPLIF